MVRNPVRKYQVQNIRSKIIRSENIRSKNIWSEISGPKSGPKSKISSPKSGPKIRSEIQSKNPVRKYPVRNVARNPVGHYSKRKKDANEKKGYDDFFSFHKGDHEA